jgi:hypothetical protein
MCAKYADINDLVQTCGLEVHFVKSGYRLSSAGLRRL